MTESGPKETRKKLTRFTRQKEELAKIAQRQKNSVVLKDLRGDNPMIPGYGPLNPDIVIVGELSTFSQPFLDKALKSNNLSGKRIYFTTLFKGVQVRKPSEKEVTSAYPYLEDELAVLKPHVVVPLGHEGVETFFTDQCITNVHGEPHEWDGYWLVPITHPRMCIADKNARLTIVNDLAKVAGALRKKVK